MQKKVKKHRHTILRSFNDEVSVAARNFKMPMFMGHFSDHCKMMKSEFSVLVFSFISSTMIKSSSLKSLCLISLQMICSLIILFLTFSIMFFVSSSQSHLSVESLSILILSFLNMRMLLQWRSSWYSCNFL